VQADRKVDPDGEDLPSDRLQEIKERVIEIRFMHAMATWKKLQEEQELREEEAECNSSGL
jgi:hypothetical protein